MDYEDSDFQSQSFQLAVEENTEFSPGSHSYSLPKFDLDDNLQIQLRFDTLVESEVLLGIPTQEENQWIEDFSRESSGLEFSSGATESCSISRRNNVWSEATSSESVDLLLKSVGQDEMIMRQAIIKESDNCDGLDSLTNQMNPSLNQDGLSPPHSENATCARSVSTHGEPVEQFSGLDKDPMDQLPNLNQDGVSQFSGLDKDVVDQLSQIDSTSQTGEGVRSINVGSSVLNSVEKEKSRGCFIRNENCNVTGLSEDVNLVDESDGNNSLNDPETPECMQVKHTTVSVQSIVNTGELNSDGPQGAKGLEKDDAETVGDHQVLSREMSQTCGGHRVDTDGHNVGDLSSLVKKVDPVSHITELSSDTMFTQHTAQMSESEHITSSKDADMVDQFIDKDTVDQVPSLNHDGFSPSKMENATCVRSMSALDESVELFSGLDKDVVDQLPQIDCSPQNGEGVRSINGGSRVLNSVEEEKFRVCLVRNESCNVTGLKEDVHLVDETEGNKSLNDSEAPECMQVNPFTASVQSFVDAGGLKSDVPQGSEGLEKDDAETVGDHHVLSGVTSQTCEGHLVDTDGDNVGDQSSFVKKDDPVSQVTELSSDAMFTQNTAQINEFEHIISSKDVDMVDQFIENSQEASFFMVEGENKSVVHSAGISANVTGIPSVQIMHTSDQTTQGCSNVESAVKQENLSENVGQGNANSDDHAEHSSSLVMETCSSTDITHESQKSEDIKDNDDCLGVHSAVTCSSSSLEFQQRCAQILIETGPSVVHLYPPDASAPENESGKLQTDSESTKLVPEIAKMASDNILDGTHHLLLKTIIAKDEAVQPQEDLHSPSHVVSSLLVKQEETVSRISILDTREISQISNESEHGKVCDHAREMEATIVGQSSLGISGIIFQNESELDVANIDAQQRCSEGLKEFPVIHDVAVKEKEGAEVCEQYNNDGVCIENKGAEVYEQYNNEGVPIEAEGIRASHEPRHPLSPSLRESSHDIGLKDLEDNEASETNNGSRTSLASTEGLVTGQTLTQSLPPLLRESSLDVGLKYLEDEASKNGNGLQSPSSSIQGVSLNGCESTSRTAALLSEADAEGHVLEAESSSLISNEPNCGSPTIISCSEASQNDRENGEGSMGSLNHIDCDAFEKEANKIKHGATDPKDNDAFDDRSFTFKVSSVLDLSEKGSVSGWKPFPNIQPYKISQAVGSSSGTSTSGFLEIDPTMSEDISCGNPRLSREFSASGSSKCNSVDKTRPMDGKTSEREAAEEGKPQNNELLYGGKEHQEGLWRLDPNTAVSGNIDQAENVDESIVHNPKENIAVEVDRKVGFEVNSMPNLSEKKTSHSWKTVHSIPPYECSQTARASPAASFTCQIDAKVLQEISRESRSRTTGAKNVRRSYKGKADDKIRLSSGKAVDKENDKERKVLKETISMKHTKVADSNSLHASPTSPAAVTQVVQPGEVRAVGFTEGSSIKSSVVTTAQNSSLPDLNSLASSHSLFQQPFTDVQQVQLRAQIFVYGSIIQGTAPDEACMLAAFGESDGGRSAWENVLHITVERLHNQKSPLSNAKTPVHQQTGARTTEAMRQTIHRTEAVCTPVGADSNKFSNMPFSSPIWTLSTSCRDGSLSSSIPKGPLQDSSKTFLPVQPYQSPHLRQFVGSTSPWLIQAPSHHATLPISETVRVTCARESSVSHHSGKGRAPSSPSVHSGSPPSGPAGKSLVMDAKRTTISPAKHASAEKPRKKRKNVLFEESSQISSFVLPRGDPVSVPAQLPTSVATTTITSAMNVACSSLVSGSSPIVSVTAQSSTSVAKTAMTSAMNVASSSPISGSFPVVPVTAQSLIAVATPTLTSAMNVASVCLVSGSTPVASALDKILGGGETETRDALPEDMCNRIEESKRQAEEAAAFAATAVRHCQSIWSQLAVQKNSGVVSDLQAKLESSAVAIAAAASVAKAAAAVAKVASDAALQAKLMADEALVTSKSGHTPEISLHNDVKNLGRVTPSSILKGRDQANNADSVLVAARKTARKRVEAASAAAKRAENLDAVLKAAEMTAEAVSQAGTIIAMGEPLPFTLTELVDGGPEGYWKVQQKSPERLVKLNNVLKEQIFKDGVKEGIGGSVEEFNEKLLNKKETNQTVELSKDSTENRTLLVDGLQRDSVSSSGHGLGAQKGCTEHDLSKTIGVVPESKIVSENASITVCTDENEGHKLVSTPNGNNFEEGSLVEVGSDGEGLGMVWLSAKVLSLMDGRAFVSYTEHAPHEGSSQPTEWVPLDDKEGNAPRIRNPHPMSVIKNEGTKKRSRAARGDYTWSVGDKVDAWIRNGWREGIIMAKSKEDETNFNVKFPAQRETSVVRAWNLRPSLIWENGKWIEWCRPVESNYLSHEGDTPQGKPAKKSRLECETDPPVEAKVKDKMTKLPGIMEQGKPDALKPLFLSTKEKVFNAGKNTKKDELGRKLTGLQKEGSKVNIGVPQPGKKRKFMEVSKVSKPTMFKSGKPQGPAFLSSRVAASDSLSSKKKPPSDHAADLQSKGKATPLGEKSVNVKGADHAADLQSKGKATPLGEKSVTNNVKGAGHDSFGNFMPNSVEPRRSNRRIQPTSRLLEGLQSSLIVSKIPAASHDKGTKAPNKGISRGRNHG